MQERRSRQTECGDKHIIKLEVEFRKSLFKYAGIVTRQKLYLWLGRKITDKEYYRNKTVLLRNFNKLIFFIGEGESRVGDNIN